MRHDRCATLLPPAPSPLITPILWEPAGRHFPVELPCVAIAVLPPSHPIPPPHHPQPFEKGWFRADRWPDSCPNKVGSPNPFCRTCSTRSNPPIEPNSEDCLRLNVMAPAAATPASKLAVMVYVHGGGGTIGSGRMYTQSAGLVHKDVILVTINCEPPLRKELSLKKDQGGAWANARPSCRCVDRLSYALPPP